MYIFYCPSYEALTAVHTCTSIPTVKLYITNSAILLLLKINLESLNAYLKLNLGI